MNENGNFCIVCGSDVVLESDSVHKSDSSIFLELGLNPQGLGLRPC